MEELEVHTSPLPGSKSSRYVPLEGLKNENRGARGTYLSTATDRTRECHTNITG